MNAFRRLGLSVTPESLRTPRPALRLGPLLFLPGLILAGCKRPADAPVPEVNSAAEKPAAVEPSAPAPAKGGKGKKAEKPATVRAEKPELVLQLGHNEPVSQVQCSPDGKLVASYSESENTVRLWDVTTGQLLRSLAGPAADPLWLVAFSPDSKHLAGGCGNGTILVWDLTGEKAPQTLQPGGEPVTALSLLFGHGRTTLVTLISTQKGGAPITSWNIATGKELRSFRDPTGQPRAAALSPDGKILASTGADNSIRLWNFNTGHLLRTLQGHADLVIRLVFTDGNTLASADNKDPAIRVWDVGAGREVRSLKGHGAAVSGLGVLPDGKTLVSSSPDGTVRIWDVPGGKQMRSLSAEGEKYIGLALPHDGKLLATVSDKHSAGVRLWDLTTGKHRVLDGPLRIPYDLALAGVHGETLACGAGGSLFLWNLTTGRVERNLGGTSTGILAASADGRTLAAGGYWAQAVSVYILRTGKLRHTLTLPPKVNTRSLALNEKGTLLAGGGSDNIIRLWNVTTGEIRGQFTGHQKEVNSLVFSPNGKTLASSSWDQTIKLWEVPGGKLLSSWPTGRVTGLAFAPDGKTLASSAFDPNASVHIWDVGTGKVLHTLNKGAFTACVAFSPDGTILATGRQDNVLVLWNPVTGKELGTYRGHSGHVWKVAFGKDGQTLFTASFDGTVKLWPLHPKKRTDQAALATLAHFTDTDGAWAVLGPGGRFDAANGGDVSGLHWVVGLEPIALSQLKERYYDPGLLAKLLGASAEPLRRAGDLDDLKLFPSVVIKSPTPDSTRITLNVTNRGGGIGRIQVFVNDKEVVADARGDKLDATAAKATLTVDLSAAPVLRGKRNQLRVIAWNADGYLSGRGMVREWTPEGWAEKEPPELYAIVAGIATYQNPQLNLRFAAKDAEDIAQALTAGAKRLFGAGKIHLTLLCTGGKPGTVPPTKANLQKAFEEARKARPGDVLVVYLAGHGLALQKGDDLYCYLTQEARSLDPAALADPVVLAQTAVTSGELIDWVKRVPALKQVMLLDTCAAAAAAAKLTEHRNIAGSQVRALERLKDRTGFHVLMGCAADRVSYEASQYQQGLLTYSLLEGMRGAALREGEFVDVSALFQYAADRVPQLARGLGGIQQPQVAAPRGTSFDIGQIKAEDKKAIPLAHTYPLILRPVLLRDDLHLTPLLRQRLGDACAVAARGPAPAVYVDAADEMPGAILPEGSYRVQGQQVKVELALRRDGKEVDHLEVVGDRNDLPGLAGKLVDAILGRLKK